MSAEFVINCPRCQGRGTVIDDDPHADRRQWITCPTCGGGQRLDGTAGRAWSTVAPVEPQTPTPGATTSRTKRADLPPGVRLVGKCGVSGKALAAIVSHPLAPPARATVYRYLIGEARHQIALARRWDVWGVFASDDWAEQNRRRSTAP